MQVHKVESQSFSELMAVKQSAGEQKFAALRELSLDQRQSLNESAVDLCRHLASQFGKSKSFSFGSRR
ncbi:hypothetical protein ACI2KR_06820 [Pseudomonas luteola]